MRRELIKKQEGRASADSLAILIERLVWFGELEEAELSVIREAKYISEGPLPAVGYFYAKKNAVRNLRLILTAKMNDIPVEDIKPRVRELY